ncbi:MAG: hypothetical protein JNK82_06280 [Myxococcaceae bacterium]|nr:hypothetical protein [Myxococcaceae bacterium]
MKRQQLLIALALLIGCGPQELAPDTETSAASQGLTPAGHLAALAQAQKNERSAAHALQLLVEPRRRVAQDLAVKRMLITAIEKKSPGDPRLKVARDSAEDDAKRIADTKSQVANLQTKQRDAAKKLEAALVDARAAALPQLVTVGTSGAFPLTVAVYELSRGLSRQVPSLHTEVQSLWADPRCAGDLVIQGTLDRYLKAALLENDAQALPLIEALQQHLSCLSQRQLRLLEGALVLQTELTVERMLAGRSAPAFASRFRQLMAVPILLVADQTRAFSTSKPGLNWLLLHGKTLAAAAAQQGSLLHRTGLFFLDPRTGRLVAITSKGQRATEDLKSALSTRLLVMRDAKGGWTPNLLPAVLEALTMPCFGVDLVLDGTGLVGEKLRCDTGCGAARSDHLVLGKGLSTPLLVSSAAAKKCGPNGSSPPPGGAGSPGGGSSGSGSKAGGGGVSIGSSATRASCVLDAVRGDRSEASRILECTAALQPGSGATGEVGGGVGGGASCNPFAEGSDDGRYTFQMCTVRGGPCETYVRRQDDTDPNTYNFYVVVEGTEVVIYNTDNPDMFPGDPASGAGGGTGSTSGSAGSSGTNPGGTAGSGSGSGTAGSGSGTAGSGSGTAGSGSGTAGSGSAGSGGSGGSDGTCAGGGWPCEGETSDCADDPECNSGGAEDCGMESGSCNNGCTGGDDPSTAFAQCMGWLPSRGGTPVPPSQPDPGTILPAPDDTGTSTFPGSALLSCAAGGAPIDSTCAGQSVMLCAEEKPNCNCPRTGVVVPNLPVAQCEAMQCANMSASAAAGEAVMSSPMGAGACGCSSVLGGS